MSAPPACAQATPDVGTDGPKNLSVLQTGRIVEGCTNSAEALKKHADATKGVLQFRFPPEPNGYLHIGHAKAMWLDFGTAVVHHGETTLRYDDTNPEGEEDVYIKAILEMVLWMGWKPARVTYTSDYFPHMYDFAIQLIKAGLAYVDHSSADELRKQREERTDSPWRDRPVAENLKLFEYMRQGRYAEGEATLRCKMDMKSDNPNLRDHVAYRVKYHSHPRTGDKWCIYPSYDYSHCIVDAIENIDYSLCTLEFETRRESYFLLLQQLGLWRPYVWEFSRLNVTGSLLSKRKINVLVQKGIVRGFDDPRLLTLAGMRRRGYIPEAINRFVERIGITRNQNVIDIRNLEQALREVLDDKSDRRFGIIDPLLVEITNWTGEKNVDAPNHPAKPERGSRSLAFGPRFYIDTSDFREDGSDSNFFGLAPGKTVGLKYNGNITCTAVEKDATGRVAKVLVTVDFDRAVKPKTNIGWLNVATAVPCEFRLYEPLLTDDRAAIDTEFLKFVDANSEKIQHGFVEPSLKTAKLRDTVQFERIAYFTVDDDTGKAGGKLVMNRVIQLKEDKEKAPPSAKAVASNAKRQPQNPPKAPAAPAPKAA